MVEISEQEICHKGESLAAMIDQVGQQSTVRAGYVQHSVAGSRATPEPPSQILRCPFAYDRELARRIVPQLVEAGVKTVGYLDGDV